jgi:hypothetical protein
MMLRTKKIFIAGQASARRFSTAKPPDLDVKSLLKESRARGRHL